jgi:hypothetical protein
MFPRRDKTGGTIMIGIAAAVIWMSLTLRLEWHLLLPPLHF